jgi:protein ImuB
MYCVLQLPNFHLQAALRHDPGALTGPAVLLDEDPRVERSRERIRITQITGAACRLGVEPGMTATQGQARCPDLRIVTRSAPAEQAAQEILLQWAGGISPRIESTGDGVCTIDLTGSRYDREPEALADRCFEAFGRMNLVVQIGVAANPELALLAAKAERAAGILPAEQRPAGFQPAGKQPEQNGELFNNAVASALATGPQFGWAPNPVSGRVRIIEPTPKAAREFLAPLPIEALTPSHELVAVLRLWGLRTLGELAALPREDAIERLGPDALPLWRQLAGGEPRPLNLHRPAEVLTESMDFEQPIEQLDALLFVLNRFLRSLEVRLAEMHLVADSLTLELRFEDGARHERAFRIPEPTRDVDLLLRTLHTYLENFRTDSPVVGVRLTATPARPPQQQLDLFQPSLRDPNRFAETLSRLEALLGSGRVGSPEIPPTHRPDAFNVVPFQPAPGAALPDRDRDREAVRFGAALRRFRPPLPARIELKKELDAETLLKISAGEIQGRVRASRGPWVASGEWWDRRQWHRREWDIELEDGSVYRVANEDRQWQVDGEYD